MAYPLTWLRFTIWNRVNGGKARPCQRRAQIWQWIRHNVKTHEGTPVTIERYRALRDDEVAKLGSPKGNRYADAVAILNTLIEGDEFIPFLTIPAYEYLS